MMTEKKQILLENRSRDVKDLGPIVVDGTESHVVLGSSDDRDGAPLHKAADGSVHAGTPGAWNKDFPSPAQHVPRSVWAAYLDHPGKGPIIKSWLDSGEITIDGRRQ